MSNIHIILHRWFERGEGWAYNSSLPTELRQDAVRIISKSLEQFRNDTITHCVLIGTTYLYLQVEADLDCPDPLAKNRHPSLAIGIISEEQLSEEQLQKYIQFARTLLSPGEFDIQPHLNKLGTPSKTSLQVTETQFTPDQRFSFLPITLIVILCISILGFFAWGYIKETPDNAIVQNDVQSVEKTDSTTEEPTFNNNDSTNAPPNEVVVVTKPEDETSVKQTIDNTPTPPSEVPSSIISNNTDVSNTPPSPRNEQTVDIPQQPISNPDEAEPIPTLADKQKKFNEELAQLEDKESKINKQDFKTRLELVQQKHQLCEKYNSEIPEIVSPILEAIKNDINTLSKYCTLSEKIQSIEKAPTETKLIKAYDFQKKYSIEEFPDARDLIESISSIINQLKEKIAQKLQHDLRNVTTSQPQLFQFSEMAKIAEDTEKIYRRYAVYYPETTQEYQNYIHLAEEQCNRAKVLRTQKYQEFEQLFRNMKIKMNPHEQLDIAKDLKKYNKTNMPQANEELFKEIDKTIEECQEKIENEPITLSNMPEIKNLSEWKLRLFKAGGNYYTSIPDKKMTKFIQMLNDIRILQEKLSAIAQKNPDKQFYPNALFILKRIPTTEITTFKNESSVSKKEYDNTVKQICNAFHVSSFGDIEQTLNFKIFFQNYEPDSKKEFILLSPEVQKEVREFIMYFCPNDVNHKLVGTSKQFNNYYKQRYNCDIIDSDESEVYPWYSLWLLSTHTFGLNHIKPQALVLPDATEAVITDYINQTPNVRYASTSLEELLVEYFDYMEIRNRIKEKKNNTVPTRTVPQ